MLRAAQAAQSNGQSVRVEMDDGRYCRLGLSIAEQQGKEESTEELLAEYDTVLK